jgi:TonB family protein
MRFILWPEIIFQPDRRKLNNSFNPTLRYRGFHRCLLGFCRNDVHSRWVNSGFGRNNPSLGLSKRSMRKVSIALLVISIVSSSSLPSQAQRHRARRQVKKPEIKLTQTASKTCISEEETEGCAIEPSAPEPETGIPNRKARCSDCIVFGRVINKPAPCYPQAAKAEDISGAVQVKIVVDEAGKVIWARAISGHQILQRAAVRAACRARFTPSTFIGRKIKVKAVGIMTYNFLLP